MSDYRGNFYSSDAYNPEYNEARITVGTVTDLANRINVTAAQVTATKVVLYTGADYQYVEVMAMISRAGVMLPTNYTIERTDNGDNSTISIKGNGSYTLTEGDHIVYMILPVTA